MSDILFTCRGCRQDLVVDATGAGLTIACPGCGQPVKVPAKGDTGIIRVPEATALRSRVKELEGILAAERRRASTAESSLKTLTARSAKTEQAAREVSAEIALLKEMIGERDVAVQVMDEALAAEVAKGEAQQKEAAHALEAAVSSTQDAGRERDEALSKLQTVESSAAKSRQRQTALQKTLAEEQEKAQTGLNRLAELEQTLAELQTHDREATARAEYFQHEVERLEDDFTRSQRDLTESTERLRELEIQHRASESEREEFSLALATTSAEHDSDLLQRNRDLAAHRDRLTIELAEARAAMLRTETQLYHAMSAREGLGAMVANLRANLEDTSELYHGMASTVDTLELEVQRLQGELRRLDEQEAA